MFAALAVAGVESVVSSISSGNAVDRSRQARVSWTLQQANANSYTAAAIMMAAHDNVAGDEAPYWNNALTNVRADVLNRAQIAYGSSGWWPDGQPDFYTDTNGRTHRQIVAEVAAGDVTSSYSGTPTPAPSTVGVIYPEAPHTLPTMVTTAKAPAPAAPSKSSSTTPYLVVGIALVVVVLIVMFSTRRGGA